MNTFEIDRSNLTERRALLVIVWAVALACPVQAFDPFLARRVVSPSGAYYVVLNRGATHGEITWDLRERRRGAPLLGPEREDVEFFGPQPSPSALEPDPLDRQMASGVLPHAPREVLVTDGPIGLVLIGSHDTNVGFMAPMTFVDAAGKVVWKIDTPEFFEGGLTEEGRGEFRDWVVRLSAIERVDGQTEHRRWIMSYGYDSRDEALWLLGTNREFRKIELSTGARSKPTAATILRWIREVQDWDRCRMLEAIVDAVLVEPGFRSGLEDLLRMQSMSASARLRAVITLRRAGDETDRSALVTSRLDDAKDGLFARTHLHEFGQTELGLRTLCEVLDGRFGHLDTRAHAPMFFDGEREAGHYALLAFRRLGPLGREQLREIVTNPNSQSVAVLNALRLQAALGVSELVPGRLIRWIRAADDDLANHAWNVLLQVDPPDLREIVVAFSESREELPAPIMRRIDRVLDARGW